MTIVVTRSIALLLVLSGLAVPLSKRAAAEVKQASMVIDANTGKVLHEQFADAPRHPASLTKMMTLYMTFSEIEQGHLSYTSKIPISAKAAGVAPSKLELEPGEEIEVLDAIKALVTKSANDVAVALAEQIGGTEYGFVRLMNERARQIGMGSTTFVNASGLPDDRQITTARDMLTLAMRLQDDFPGHYRLFSLKSFDFRGKTYRTHNTLMHGFPGMDGIKTGYTKASGFNLVSSVTAENKHIVAAVFGGKTASARNAHMRVLLYRALQEASTEKTRAPSKLIALQRPAADPAVEVAWTAKTKPAPPPVQVVKTRKVPVPLPVAVPVPVRATAPAPVPAASPDAPRGHDAIAQVLANSSQPVSEAAQPRLDLQGLREAMSEEPSSTERVVQPLQASAGGPQDIAALIKSSIADDTPGIAPREVSPLSVQVAQARPPSTLESQALQLAQATPPVSRNSPPAGQNSPPAGLPPSHLKGPMPGPQFPAAPVGRGFEIQIGAYGTSQEAQTKIDLVRTRAVGLLDGHGGVTLPVQKADRQMFRARFVSFDENAASSTCLELRRLAIDCFVMKAE